MTLVKSQDEFLSLKPIDSNSLDLVDNLYSNIVKAAKIHIIKNNSFIELENNLFDLVESLSKKEEFEALDHKADEALNSLKNHWPATLMLVNKQTKIQTQVMTIVLLKQVQKSKTFRLRAGWPIKNLVHKSD